MQSGAKFAWLVQCQAANMPNFHLFYMNTPHIHQNSDEYNMNRKPCTPQPK